MNSLITSDIHLTDDQKDSYRFGLFPWLVKQQEKYKTDALYILGDCTQKKDYHSSTLVNKTVEGLKLLKPPIFILRGNHDGHDPTTPYFKFLNSIEGITFCVEPRLIKDHQVLMIPHQTSQAAFDKAYELLPNGLWGIMCHQTFDGAIAETGSRLTGLRASLISRIKPRFAYAGDVHKPQVSPPVTYVGAPYHVRHGDQFTPRVLLLKDGKEIDLHFPAPKKLSLKIRDLSEFPKLSKGDQVKVTLELTRSEAVEWVNHKKSILDHCKQHGIEVYGTECKVAEGTKHEREVETSNTKSNLDYFQTFCITEQVPMNKKQVGEKILEG